jgi:HAE1 family hydrophobic/amphiphilic exporter-1
MSLFVSFTVTPLLASRFSRLEHLSEKTLMGRFGLWFERQYDRFTNWYAETLRWALSHRLIVGALTIAMFFGSISLLGLGYIGFEFITQADRGEFSVALELPPGSTIENTNLTSIRAERIVGEIPEVSKVFVNVGASAEGFVSQSSNNVTDLAVTLAPKNQRIRSTDEVAAEIKHKLQSMPGVKVRVNPIGIFGQANQSPIQIVVSSTVPEDTRKAALQVHEMLRKIPGTADVRLSAEEGKPETRIEIDRAKMADFGLTLAEVGGTLRVALTGDDESKFRDGTDEYDIRVMLDEFNRSSTADVGSLSFMNRMGKTIELRQFANIYQTTGPTKLQRRDRSSSITVMAQVNGRPSGTIGAEFQQALAKTSLPAGVTVFYDGDLKNQADSGSSMGLALLAGILFVYMIMVALYDSYIWPFVVLFSIPLAMIGALLALALSMSTLNIFSMLGIIMLIGLVAKNAILLVDFTNRLREDGTATFEALVAAGRDRLRPILMTTLTMIIGMMPIALSKSPGAEWKAGLAWALIGGLTSSMVLTLVFVPVVYLTVDNLRRRIPAFFRRLFRRGERDTAPMPEGAVAASDIAG